MIDRQKILASADLPTLPSVAVRLLDLSQNAEAEISDFVTVIRNDPAISAKIVQAANSPYFGMTSDVTSVEGAIPRLGTTVVTSVALSFSLVMESRLESGHSDLFGSVWSRSLLQAVSAEYLAKKLKKNPPCQYFLVGLLCDIGVLAQLKTITSEYVPLLRGVLESGGAVVDAEREHLGIDHVEIGSRMMEKWQLPASLVDAVRHHHASMDELKKVDENDKCANSSMRRITRFATYLGEYLTRNGDPEIYERLQEFGEQFLDIERADLQDVIEEIRNQTDAAAQLMSIDTASLPRPSELLEKANSRLAEIALRGHAAMAQVSAKRAELELRNMELEATNSQLYKESGIDSLTGVNNRGSFDSSFEQMVSECVGTGGPAAIIFADVDKFKSLNDDHGHQFGDRVLQRIADILTHSVRVTDFVARYGGEEFVVVAVNCPPEVVTSIAERIRRNVEETEITHKGMRVPVTISVGGCALKPREHIREEQVAIANEMLQAADAAMYRCKRNGRNTTHVHVCEHMDAVRNSIIT